MEFKIRLDCPSGKLSLKELAKLVATIRSLVRWAKEVERLYADFNDRFFWPDASVFDLAYYIAGYSPDDEWPDVTLDDVIRGMASVEPGDVAPDVYLLVYFDEEWNEHRIVFRSSMPWSSVVTRVLEHGDWLDTVLDTAVRVEDYAGKPPGHVLVHDRVSERVFYTNTRFGRRGVYYKGDLSNE